MEKVFRELPKLDFFSDPQGDDLTWFPIGFELKNESNYSSIQFTWANQVNSRKLTTELGLKPDSPIASFLMHPKNGDREVAKFHFNRQLNFNTSLPFDQTKILTFQNRNEVISLVSANRIILKKTAEEITAKINNNRSAIHLLLGESILLNTPNLLSELETCDIESNLTAIYKCIDNIESKKQETKIEIINRVENENDYLYPYWLKNISNQETFYIPVRSLSENVLSLNKNFSYQLYNISSNENRQYKIVKEASSVEISLPATKTTNITFSPSRKAFLSVESKYPRGQFNFIKSRIPKNTKYMNSKTLLVESWPLNLKLPENDYSIKIFDDNYTYCVETLTAQSSDKILCKSPKSLPRINFTYWPDDKEIYADPMHKRQTLNLNTKHSFIVEDDSTPFAIKINTDNSKAQQMWQSYYKKKKLSKLPLVKRFTNEQLPNAKLTLKCPRYNFDLEAYKWLIKTIKPDFTEVFNCSNQYQDRKIISYIHENQRKKEIKIIPANRKKKNRIYETKNQNEYPKRFKGKFS